MINTSTPAGLDSALNFSVAGVPNIRARLESGNIRTGRISFPIGVNRTVNRITRETLR